MPQEISVQILSQTSENIQKLFEFVTRIDERMKSLQEKLETFEETMDEIGNQHILLIQKVAVMESRDIYTTVSHDVDEHDKGLVELDKRVNRIETVQGSHMERWKGVASFVVQLIWVVIAAYILTRLHLQPPGP